MIENTKLFREYLNTYGRQVEVIITDLKTNIEYTNDQVVSITKTYNTDLCKSTMQQLDFEIEGNISIEDEVNVKLGLFVDGSEVQYIDFGNFIVVGPEYVVDTNSTKFKAYDYMYKAHVDFDSSVLSFPCTLYNIVFQLCSILSIPFEMTEFNNSDKVIESNVFLNSALTYRDVFDIVAEVTGLNILVSKNKLILKKYELTDIEINENDLKSLTLGKKYGPINSLVFSRSAESDNLYRKDDTSIEENGLCELKITDNLILDTLYRNRFIDDCFSVLKGLEYTIFDLESFGCCILEPGDLFIIKDLDGESHQTISFNSVITINSGINEKMHVDEPKLSCTDYASATKDERKDLSTYLQVNKELGEIKAKINEVDSKIETIDVSLYRAQLLYSGTVINENNRTITLECKVYNGNDDVTDKQQSLQFDWRKNGQAYKLGKSIEVGSTDVDVSANFKCVVTIGEKIIDTGYVTIVDESDIANLGNSYLDVSGAGSTQYLNNDGTYFPNWTSNPLIITPNVMDGNIVIDLNNCDISYKKIVNGKETALSSDEVVKNSVLKVSKNIMSKTVNSLNYVCYVTYKNTNIKLFKDIVLNIAGGKGDKGDTGGTGPKGNDGTSVTILSTSIKYQSGTSGTTKPTGTWLTSIPTVTQGNYLWTQTIVTYSDGNKTESYSVSRQPVNGTDGKNGVSPTVSSTKIEYQQSSSGTTVPTGTWSSAPPTATAGQYMWTRTTVTYSDSKTSVSYSVSKNGSNGATGKGIVSITKEFYLSTSKTSQSGGSWSTVQPTWVKGKYLWTREKVVYSNPSSTEYTTPKVDSSWEAVNDIKDIQYSATAPSDTTRLWFDTTDNLLKYWNGSSWEVSNDFAEDINNMKQQVTTEYTSAINQLKTSINTLVEQLQTTTTDNTSSIERLTSQFQQNADSISFITSSINEINNTLTGVSTKEEISKWARFQNGILELGASNSPFAVKLSNTELGFYQNDMRIAYLSNQQLNISQAVVMKQINLGIYQIVYDEQYGLLII